jgi:uncharacterized protein YprB with RNaseH-like and TPR domain
LAGNLRDRLKRIQQVKQTEHTVRTAEDVIRNADISPFAAQGWVPAGHLTLRREVTAGTPIALPPAMPAAAGLVMPGIRAGTDYRDLLFFDLETTGLSTGAGTVAFLAAFGRLDRAGKLRITQYLLLDYPGESDFIEALLGEFGDGLTMVSYNGKCFDSQILKTRCLMNGIVPPEYRHADLLHPARRLWKRLLPDCSQATIETGILGIDRTGDIPGALAPDIWFAFLRHGETEPLFGICEHNRRDIAGLATIFSALVHIADNPFEAAKSINFDLEALALRWYESSRHEIDTSLRETGQRLLRFAAEKGPTESGPTESGHPRAAFVYALSLLKAGSHDDGRTWLLKTASAACPPSLQASALRALAIDSERRLKNAEEALSFTEQALELLAPDSPRREEFERRLQRLRNKKPRRTRSK